MVKICSGLRTNRTQVHLSVSLPHCTHQGSLKSSSWAAERFGSPGGPWTRDHSDHSAGHVVHRHSLNRSACPGDRSLSRPILVQVLLLHRLHGI
ncbi:hypothetical protein BC834DRAFT_877042 [Gloeopeniophorella convolvens]|nr:hypothetical protein BC834DRAFT_877042 [Gloeopeniophorella convolvens]